MAILASDESDEFRNILIAVHFLMMTIHCFIFYLILSARAVVREEKIILGEMIFREMRENQNKVNEACPVCTVLQNQNSTAASASENRIVTTQAVNDLSTFKKKTTLTAVQSNDSKTNFIYEEIGSQQVYDEIQRNPGIDYNVAYHLD